MSKKYLLIISLLLIFIILFSACSNMSENSSRDSGTSDRAPQTEEGYRDEVESEDVASEDTGIIGRVIQPEKVITTISLGFETADFDDFTDQLEDLILENEGYIEYSDIWYGGSSRSFRRGDYTIRIPQSQMNRFKDNVKDIGNLLNESTSREDVTSQYTDTESRLRVVETKEERILALLESADIMSDIIELERELSNIIYEKEYLSSELMDLDDRIDYSTIHLNVEEVERFTTTEDMDTGLGTRIKNSLSDSLHFFTTSMESIIIFLVYLIPFLIVLVIIAFIGKRVYDKYRN